MGNWGGTGRWPDWGLRPPGLGNPLKAGKRTEQRQSDKRPAEIGCLGPRRSGTGAPPQVSPRRHAKEKRVQGSGWSSLGHRTGRGEVAVTWVQWRPRLR